MKLYFPGTMHIVVESKFLVVVYLLADQKPAAADLRIFSNQPAIFIHNKADGRYLVWKLTNTPWNIFD